MPAHSRPAWPDLQVGDYEARKDREGDSFFAPFAYVVVTSNTACASLRNQVSKTRTARSITGTPCQFYSRLDFPTSVGVL